MMRSKVKGGWTISTITAEDSSKMIDGVESDYQKEELKFIGSSECAVEQKDDSSR